MESETKQILSWFETDFSFKIRWDDSWQSTLLRQEVQFFNARKTKRTHRLTNDRQIMCFYLTWLTVSVDFIVMFTSYCRGTFFCHTFTLIWKILFADQISSSSRGKLKVMTWTAIGSLISWDGVFFVHFK